MPPVHGRWRCRTPLLSGSVNSTSIFVEGRTYAPGQRGPGINRLVSRDFFDTTEMPIRLGRFHDRGQPDRTLGRGDQRSRVRKYFPNENPLGHRMGSSIERAGQLEIVGVLRDAKYNSMRDPSPPTQYVPTLQQARMDSAVFQLRTVGDPVAVVGAIREAVRQIDPNLPMMDVATQIEQVEKRLAPERAAQAAMLGAWRSCSRRSASRPVSARVARRTNEIGIRMAPGAQRQDVLRLVMRESMLLVVAGIAIGGDRRRLEPSDRQPAVRPVADRRHDHRRGRRGAGDRLCRRRLSAGAPRRQGRSARRAALRVARSGQPLTLHAIVGAAGRDVGELLRSAARPRDDDAVHAIAAADAKGDRQLGL